LTVAKAEKMAIESWDPTPRTARFRAVALMGQSKQTTTRALALATFESQPDVHNKSLDQTADRIQRKSRADGPPLISFAVRPEQNP
jgi:hypothetical protein